VSEVLFIVLLAPMTNLASTSLFGFLSVPIPFRMAMGWVGERFLVLPSFHFGFYNRECTIGNSTSLYKDQLVCVGTLGGRNGFKGCHGPFFRRTHIGCTGINFWFG
jgi:hypothetical protein